MNGLKKSPWILHYDASSCNGCDIETLACLTPVYDVERLGVVNTGNPKHADIFLVTGAVNEQNQSVIRNLYRQLPEPNVVVAVGACASTGGIFRECYNVSGGVDTILPVDVYQPGCPPRPEAIIDGVVRGLAVLEEKHQLLASAKDMDQALFARAEKRDAPQILALRKAACQAEIHLYGDDSFPAMQQTLEELEKESDRQMLFKAVVNGKVIGSLASIQQFDSVNLTGLAVHPYFRNSGVVARLLRELEEAFPAAKRFETFVGTEERGGAARSRRAGLSAIPDRGFHARHLLDLPAKVTAMNPEQTLEVIAVETLLERVQALQKQGQRLVQICATTLPGQFELTYSFDLDTRLTSLRVLVPADQARVPSIGSIYGCAFLYENEMHDLFNIQVEGLAIDFKGNLYNTTVKFAFSTTKSTPAAKTPAARLRRLRPRKPDHHVPHHHSLWPPASGPAGADPP